MNRKRTSIEFVRFWASISILLFHFGSFYLEEGHYFPLSFIFVEFFFLVSGFFMMMHITERENPLAPPFYVWRKIKGFFPPLAIAFFVQYIIFTLSNGLSSVTEVLRNLFHFKWEFLLLHAAGFIQDPQFGRDYLMGQTWYLSAMVIALIIAYPLALHFRKFFLYTVCPLAVILIYAFLIQTMGTLNVGNEYVGFVLAAILRGFAGTCMGALSYCAYRAMKAQDFCLRYKPFVTGIEVGSYVAVASLFFRGRNMSAQDSLFYVLCFAVFVILGCLDQTAVSRFLNGHGTRALTFLGDYSLYLYLCHWNVVMGLKYFLPGWMGLPAFAVYLPVVLLYALALMAFDRKRKGSKPVVILCLVLIATACCVPYIP